MKPELQAPLEPTLAFAVEAPFQHGRTDGQNEEPNPVANHLDDLNATPAERRLTGVVWGRVS